MSDLGKLNWLDLGKGLIVAILSSILTVIYTTLQAGGLTFNWKEILTVGLTSAVAYLIKNLFTSPQNQPLIK
jgi:hypothetical protein